MAFGTLYLIPVPLTPDAADASFTPYGLSIIRRLDEFIVENEKTARKFLKLAQITIPQSQLILHDFGKHKRDSQQMKIWFQSLRTGKDVGLMSEAGCPGVADPGAELVAAAHQQGIRVEPLVGPSSILLALMASGFNGQRFAFHGYLPIEPVARATKIKQLEKEAQTLRQTQLFMETPFRNETLWKELLKHLKPQTLLSLSVDLTGPDAWSATKTVAEWKSHPVQLHKRPVIFSLFSS
jgi:16S rRNA (cytidine1402-2'-O)-methyltransferase